MTRPNYFLALALAAAVLLTAGCGDDQPNPGLRPSMSAASGAPAPRSAAPPLAPASPSPASGDSLAAPDPLSAGGDGLASDAAKVSQSMNDEANGKSSPDSPLDSTAPADDLHQPWLWPTTYTHWLKVEEENADVEASVNGVQIGGVNDVGSHDITMKLHRGSNWLTVRYTPHSLTSHASVVVLEGEHAPPLPPLANFKADPLADAPRPSAGAKLQPVTQTLSFIAH